MQEARDARVRVIHVDDHLALLEAAAETGAKKALAAVGLTEADAEHIRGAINLQKGLAKATDEMWRRIGGAFLTVLFLGGCAALAAKFDLRVTLDK